MFKIVRSRYHYAEVVKPKSNETFDDLSVSSDMTENDLLSVSEHLIAVCGRSTAGGEVTILNRAQPGRYGVSKSRFVRGHTCGVCLAAFNPFNELNLVTAASDGSMLVWNLPESAIEEGLKENVTQPTYSLAGHSKHISNMMFHPSAANILLSASWDCTISVWNISTGSRISEFALEEIPTMVTWSASGDCIFAVCKDNKIHVLDSHTGAEQAAISFPYVCTKAPRVEHCGSTDVLIFSGSSQGGAREIFAFKRDESGAWAEIFNVSLDPSSSSLIPHWDETTRCCYFYGRGSTEILAYEILPEGSSPALVQAFKYNTTGAIKSLVLAPGRTLAVTKGEVAKLYILTASTVNPHTVILQTRSGGFQAKYYSGYLAGEPVISAQEFAEGQNAFPVVKQFSDEGEAQAAVRVEAVDTNAMIQKEIDAIDEKVAELTSQINDMMAKREALAAKLAESEQVSEPMPEEE